MDIENMIRDWRDRDEWKKKPSDDERRQEIERDKETQRERDRIIPCTSENQNEEGN